MGKLLPFVPKNVIAHKEVVDEAGDSAILEMLKGKFTKNEVEGLRAELDELLDEEMNITDGETINH